MGAAAMQSQDKGWEQAARLEIINALQTDPTAADIMLDLITIDLNMDNVKEAQFYYDQFKRISRKSPFIQFVKDLHKQPAAPSLANPDGIGVTK